MEQHNESGFGSRDGIRFTLAFGGLAFAFVICLMAI